MAEFVVHTGAGSPFGRSVVAALVEKGAAWRLSPIGRELFRTPEHLALHPFGRMPILEHRDFRLYETQAILRYLDRVLPDPPLTPADPRAAAQMDLVMGVTDWYLFQGVCNVIGFHRVVAPRLMGALPDEAAIAAAMPKARIVVAELARLLGEKPFMAGAAPTLADLHAGPQLAFLARTPEWAELAAGHPELAGWLARLEERPSFVASRWESLEALAPAA